MPDIIKERKFLVISLSIILLLALAAVLWLFVIGQAFRADPAAAPGEELTEIEDNEELEEIEILPNNEIEEENEEEEPPRRPADPFSGPLRLKGIILSGSKEDMAIIEAGGISYLVTEGQAIEDYWRVESIERRSVRLWAEGRDLVLDLSGR